MPPRILVFAGSIRTGSYNAKLATLAAKELAVLDAEVTLISLADFALPLFDADFEADKGVPANAEKLCRMIGAQDGVFLASPEYNAGVSPLMKNTLDWISRVGPPYHSNGYIFQHRAFALGAASPGQFGGMRGLIQLRQVIELGLGGIVVPVQINVAHATKAFDGDGELADPRMKGMMRTVARHLVELADALKMTRNESQNG